jgi:hypothetical protein
MKKIAFVIISLFCCGCVGTGGLGIHRKSNAELKAHFSELERELASYQAGEQDQSRLDHFRKLAEEESRVARELYDRCHAGDKEACLP